MARSDKPDRKKKKSDRKETPSKTTSKKESAQEKLTRQVGEEVVHKFREEEENRERESHPKKHKKKESSHRKETSAGWDSSEEDDHCDRKKKKDAKAREAQEAERRAEERKKERAEDMRLARGKLINKERREKYSLECPELFQYQKKNISERQRGSVNLDDHTTYLWEAWKDKSLYPHNNVMSGDRLIALLEKYGLTEKADKVQAVIKKGLNSYAPSGMLATGDPVIEPKYFIWVIQK